MPDIDEVEIVNNLRVLPLIVLVTFQLKRWILDDMVDLRDMIDVGLIDATWPARFPQELAARLQYLLDPPDG